MKNLIIIMVLLVSLIGCQEKKQEYYVLTQDIQEQIKEYIANQKQIKQDAIFACNSYDLKPIVEFENNAISVYITGESYPNFRMYQRENGDYFYYYFIYEEEELSTQNEADINFKIRIPQFLTNDFELASYHVPFQEKVSLYDISSYWNEEKNCIYNEKTDTFECDVAFKEQDAVKQIALDFYHEIASKGMQQENIEKVVKDIADIIETSEEKTTDKPGVSFYEESKIYNYALLESDDFSQLTKGKNMISYNLDFMSAGGYNPSHVDNHKYYFLTIFYNEAGQLSQEHYFIYVDWKETKDNVGPSIILETYPVIYDEKTNTANIKCLDGSGEELVCIFNLIKENDYIGTLQVFTTDEAGYSNSLSTEIELRQVEEFQNLKSGVYYDGKEKITYYVTSEGFVCTKSGMEYALVKDTGNRYNLEYIRDDGPTEIWYIEEDGRIKYCDWNQDCRYLEKVGELNEEA